MKITLIVDGEIRELDTKNFSEDARIACETMLSLVQFYEQESEEDEYLINTLSNQVEYLSLLRLSNEQKN